MSEMKHAPTDYIDIVFDGPPSHESGRFVEVENSRGRSINFGEWVERSDGFWALRIVSIESLKAERDELKQEIERLKAENIHERATRLKADAWLAWIMSTRSGPSPSMFDEFWETEARRQLTE